MFHTKRKVLDNIMFCIRSTPNDVMGRTPFSTLWQGDKHEACEARGFSNKTVATRDAVAEYSKRWSTVKHYTLGQRVLVRNQYGQPYMQEGVVVCAIADHMYEIKIGKAYHRYNQSHLETFCDNLELGLEDIDANREYDEVGVQGAPNVKT